MVNFFYTLRKAFSFQSWKLYTGHDCFSRWTCNWELGSSSNRILVGQWYSIDMWTNTMDKEFQNGELIKNMKHIKGYHYQQHEISFGSENMWFPCNS